MVQKINLYSSVHSEYSPSIFPGGRGFWREPGKPFAFNQRTSIDDGSIDQSFDPSIDPWRQDSIPSGGRLVCQLLLADASCNALKTAFCLNFCARTLQKLLNFEKLWKCCKDPAAFNLSSTQKVYYATLLLVSSCTREFMKPRSESKMHL